MDELNLFFTIFQLHHRKGIKSTSQNEYMQNIDIWLCDNNDTSGIFIQIWNKSIKTAKLVNLITVWETNTWMLDNEKVSANSRLLIKV